MKTLCKRFEDHEDDHGLFERIENPLSTRPDLTAFLLLNQLVPEIEDIVASTDHDLIYLQTDPEKLTAVITDADILTLVRCGVRYDKEYDCLSMFV